MASEYEILELIGRQKFEALQMRLGGTRVYIPVRLYPEHPLVAAVGWEAAKLCSEHLGNCVVHIRKSAILRRRNNAINELARAGIPAQAIELLLGLKLRTIRDIVRQ